MNIFKVIKNLALYITPFLAVISLEAQTILVSDIDDTIKASNVRSKVNRLLYACAVENEIKGMSRLYSQLASEIPDLEIKYVSSAPEFFMRENHEYFLEYNSFPNGELSLRKSFFDSSNDHRISTIEMIISETKPQTLILIGDNGESDPEIYDYIFNKYSQKMSILQFIRITYPHETITNDQTAFVNPIEICLKLEESGIGTCSDSLIDGFYKEITQEEVAQDFGSYYFHPYMDCNGYQWPELNFDRSELFENISNHLEHKCHTQTKSLNQNLKKQVFYQTKLFDGT